MSNASKLSTFYTFFLSFKTHKFVRRGRPCDICGSHGKVVLAGKLILVCFVFRADVSKIAVRK